MNTNTCEYNSHGNVPFVSAFVSSRVVPDVWICVSMQKKTEYCIPPTRIWQWCLFLLLLLSIRLHCLPPFNIWVWVYVRVHVCVYVMFGIWCYRHHSISPHPYSLCTSLTWTIVSMNDVLLLVFLLFFFPCYHRCLSGCVLLFVLLVLSFAHKMFILLFVCLSVCLAAFWTWKTFLLLLLYISPSILLCFYYMLLLLLLFFLSIHCCCWLVFTLCFFCCFHFLPLNSLWTRSFS